MKFILDINRLIEGSGLHLISQKLPELQSSKLGKTKAPVSAHCQMVFRVLRQNHLQLTDTSSPGVTD